jgi:serine/threonine-protein kinase RsbW
VKPTPMIFRLTLASNAGQIRRVESFLKKIRHAVHLDEIQQHKLMVSLTEAVNNAITCEVLPGWLVMLVNDHGHGFQPEKIVNPLKKKNLLRTSGRGIFLMRTLMDKVIFESHRTGTQVQLWLDLNK